MIAGFVQPQMPRHQHRVRLALPKVQHYVTGRLLHSDESYLGTTIDDLDAFLRVMVILPQLDHKWMNAVLHMAVYGR